LATEYYLLSIDGVTDVYEMSSTHVMKSDDVVANDTLTNGTDLIDAWVTNALPDWLAFQSENYQVRRITARRINPSGSAVSSVAFQIGAQMGTVSEATSPLQLAPCVRLIPGTLGSTAGKCFLPCPPIGSVNNNAYAGTYASDVAVYFGLLTAGITNTFDWTLAIHHKKAATFSDCVGFNLSPSFGFQGRRRYPIG